MNQITLPRFARMRRDADEVGAEAVIPVATTTSAAPATHLADDRRREPTFDDLIAGNDREPSHEDLLADDEFPDAEREEFKPLYPGVAAAAIAWLRAQDTEPATHDEHTFDFDRLVPVGVLRTFNPAATGTDDDPPTMPAVADSRLLFDALDALDRLPGLYTADAAAFEMAASVAAIQTYTALRPDLLDRHEVRMHLAPLTEQLAEPTPEPANHKGQLTAAWASIYEAQIRFVIAGFVPDHRFYTALKLDALDEAIGDLIDATGDVRGVFDAEADDIELIAIEAGLPMREDDEQDGAEMDEAVESTGHLPGYYDADPDPEAEQPAPAASAWIVTPGADAWSVVRATEQAESEA